MENFSPIEGSKITEVGKFEDVFLKGGPVNGSDL